jgi:membrane associated rhomboid family serine protease
MSRRKVALFVARGEAAAGREAFSPVVVGAGTTGGGVPAETERLPEQPPATIMLLQQNPAIANRLEKAARARLTIDLDYTEVSLLFASREARRSSSQLAASVSFSETSLRNCAVRSSVLGARSSSTNRRSLPSSSSSLRPTSSSLSMSLLLSSPYETLSQFRYYRNAQNGSQGGALAGSYQWQRRIDRMKNAAQGFFGGESNQPRPKICPACGSLVGISATRCHECGANLTFSLAAASKKLSGLFGDHEAPVTSALLIANIFMFGVTFLAVAAHGEAGGLRILWGMGGEATYRLGMSGPYPIFFQHQWYRLVTAMFLHGGLIHIGFNMMSLMQLGPALEELYGSARYFFLYVVTGAFGFLVSSFPIVFLGHYSLGASGALLGLVGALLAVTTKRGGAFMRDLRARLISSVVILFMLGFSGMGLDNAAHFAGLAAGFVLGKIFVDRQPMNARERRRAYAMGWLAGLVVVASFVLMLVHYRDPISGQ